MAILSSLVHELVERFATSSSTSPNIGDDDALEIRCRTVLPNLINTYVVPSSTANVREVLSVLKLISITANCLPGAYYRGKASAVLPVIGRILPFFAEPAFCSRHGVMFETVGALLSLLRTAERDAYRQFFIDAMLVVEDLLYIASVCADKSRITDSTRLSLKCFCGSFTVISSYPALICDLPASSKPIDGSAILINLTGNERWQPFATQILKLLIKCLTEGTLFVEGLVNASFVSSAFNLLCYGDADLHMACFDFARVIVGVIDADIVPHEILIKSISSILSEDGEGISVFRNMVYDSSIGACLHALHSNCPDDVVKLTAVDVVNVFPHSVRSTKSNELKAALCSAYIRIAKTCPPHIWKPQSLVYMLCSPEPCFPLIDCFQVAVFLLGPDRVGGRTTKGCSTALSTSIGKGVQSSRVGEKRPVQDLETYRSKRQKIKEEILTFNDDEQVARPVQDLDTSRSKRHKVKEVLTSNDNVQVAHELAPVIAREREEEYADNMHNSLLLFAEHLEPPSVKANSLKPEVAMTALSILCIAFCKYPETNLSICIFQHMQAWIPWICDMAKQGNSISFDLSIYLEAVHSILLLRGPLVRENKLFRNKGDGVDLLHVVLKLPWKHSLVVTEPHRPWKLKCLSLQVLSKIGPNLNTESDLEVLDLGLHDEAEEVRRAAVILMPVIVSWSGHGVLTHMFRRVEFLGKDEHAKVKKVLPLTLGFLACLYGSCSAVDSVEGSACELFLNIENDKQTLDHLLQGFWCSRCDRRVGHNHELYSKIIYPPDMQMIEISLDCDFIHLQSLFFKLLYDESSEEVQVACVKLIQRILMHGPKAVLLKTRSEWIKCVELLLLHRKKAIREAFCSRISFFLDDPILSCLFSDEEASNKTREQRFLDKIKHALAAAKDPRVFETLLESTAEIMIAVDIYSQLFLFSLILLIEQLDNPHVPVRLTASRLIIRSCFFHVKGGFDLILLKVVHIRNELYDYLSTRLQSRPEMVREFAEAVIGIETEELVKKMIPFVLPKLVVTQQDNDFAVGTLKELAKCLKTDMVSLIVNWLPKVLAFALNRADEQELLSVLQFYHVQAGSDNQEIFAAALPELLDELVCFLDGGDSEEINIRLARVPQMIKEIARVLSGTDDLPSFLRNHFLSSLMA